MDFSEKKRTSKLRNFSEKITDKPGELTSYYWKNLRLKIDKLYLNARFIDEIANSTIEHKIITSWLNKKNGKL